MSTGVKQVHVCFTLATDEPPAALLTDAVEKGLERGREP